jgi:hypothetical protein
MNTSNKYRFENDAQITYEDAGNVIGISTQSITGFANENEITRGLMLIRGRMRGVLKTDEFYKVIREKNYFNDQDVEVHWNK